MLEWAAFLGLIGHLRENYNNAMLSGSEEIGERCILINALKVREFRVSIVAENKLCPLSSILPSKPI